MNSAVAPILLIVAAATGAFAYFQAAQLQESQRQLQESQRQVYELSKKLEANTAIDMTALQERCAKQARKEFKDNGWVKEHFAGFTNHYNAKLNRCFMLVKSISSAKDGKGSIIENKVLTDAFEGKDLGEYMRSTAMERNTGKLCPLCAE